MLKALALLATLIVTQTPGPVTLKRTFAADESAAYNITFKMAQFDGTALLKYKVKKLGEKGTASIETDVSEVKDIPFGGSDPMTKDFDEHGMVKEAELRQDTVLHTIFGLASFVTASEAKVDEVTKVKWSDSGFAIDGTFTIKELKEGAGKKLALVHSVFTATPEGQSVADVKMDQTIEVETGRLVKAELEVIIHDDPAKITFKRKD